MTEHPSSILAEIPIFDMKGIDFLWFYGISLIGAALWSLGRRSGILSKFSNPGAGDVDLADPCEAAYLAGGVTRCAQLAVVRLLEKGFLESKRVGSKNHLSVVKPATPEMNEVERSLYQAVLAYGEKGMPMASARSTVAAHSHHLEVKLAKSGLRPEAAERGGIGFSAVLPLILLIAVGAVKVLVGLFREKPVGFLLVGLFLTVWIAIAIGKSAKLLTPEGQRVLDRMKSRHQEVSNDGSSDLVAMSFGIALMGPAVIPHYGTLSAIDGNLQRHLSEIEPAKSAGGWSSGCGSGCSSGDSGCGGGGCGGCGGD